MESKVKSHISNKTYITNLDKLEEEDKDLKSELYIIPISGHKIMVAPGKSRMDENGIAFCYVYVIQKERVLTKLGVYEKKSDSMPLIFDLSTFPEGSFCLFEEFEKNPSKLIDFEMKNETTVFDFLISEFTKIDDKRKALKSAYKIIYESLIKEENKKDSQMKPILKVISAATKDKDSPVTDEFLYTLKDNASDKAVFVYTILALQYIFKMEIRLKTDNDKYQEIAGRWKIQDPDSTIEVDVDTYEIIQSNPELDLDKFTPNPEDEIKAPNTKLDDSLPKESLEETVEKTEEIEPDTRLDESTPIPESFKKTELKEIPEDESVVDVPELAEEVPEEVAEEVPEETIAPKKTRKPRTPKSETKPKASKKTKEAPLGTSLNIEPIIKAPPKLKLKSKTKTKEDSS